MLRFLTLTRRGAASLFVWHGTRPKAYWWRSLIGSSEDLGEDGRRNAAEDGISVSV